MQIFTFHGPRLHVAHIAWCTVAVVGIAIWLASTTPGDGLQLAVHKSWPEAYQARDIHALTTHIQQLQEAGLPLFLLASYFNPAHSDADVLARDLARVRLNIELARRCQIGDVEADQLGRRGERVRATHPAPAREVGPILGVGLQRVLRRRLTRIVTRRFDQAVERARASDMGGQGDRVALRISAVVPLMAIGTFRGF